MKKWTVLGGMTLMLAGVCSVPAVVKADETVETAGIYAAEQDGNGVLAGMVTSVTGSGDLEYRWLSYDIKADKWSVYQDWTVNSEWIQYNPGTYGDYLLQGEVRPAGNEGAVKSDCIGVNHHPNIKGKCQMPYTGEGGGYLIGVESYDNPNNAYSYELLVMDCTKYAAGDPNPWIYSSGQKKVSGNAFWTVWQPEFGYYWTLFRVYDENGVMVDEDCYGFENTQSAVQTTTQTAVPDSTPADVKKDGNESGTNADSYETRIVELVNEERQKEGLGALAIDPDLMQAADVRAQEINTKFSHTRPDGRRCFSIFEDMDIDHYYSKGENIAYNYKTPEDVMNGWMNSPGHRANILKEDYQYIGVGAYYDNGWNYVQLFGGEKY